MAYCSYRQCYVQMMISVCWIFQQAAYHPEVSKDVQMRALRYGNECATGYLGLLEHVLVVRHQYSHN